MPSQIRETTDQILNVEYNLIFIKTRRVKNNSYHSPKKVLPRSQLHYSSYISWISRMYTGYS